MDWDKDTLAEHSNDMTLNLNCYGPQPVHMTYDNSIDLTRFLEQLILGKAKALPMSEYK